jgi:quinol monooxygenase YgiN
MKYGIYTRHTAKTGERDKLLDVLLRTGEALKDNPACIHWVVNTAENPDQVWVNVVWTNKEDHDATLGDETIQTLMGEAKELLSSEVKPEQIFVTPVGGKGLPD